MPTMNSKLFIVFFALLQLFCVLQTIPVFAAKNSYIVYLGSHPHAPGTGLTADDLLRVQDSHHDFLASFLGSKEEAKESMFYSYKRNINGFAAVLDEHVAARIAEHPDVVSVLLNQPLKLLTTHSWDFLGLENNGVVHHQSLWNKANFGETSSLPILIPVCVWPESKSFNDRGYGPIPSKWKGICQNDTTPRHGIRCNKKLIGARYFKEGLTAQGFEVKPYMNSPRDFDGHGTHTLSTAGGNFVEGVSVHGLANGTAKGGSPRARVAAYKACWPTTDGSVCFPADTLKAFEMAIHDGVDVISVSIGSPPADYFRDSTSIGAFHAMKNGISVVFGAGNSGPAYGTIGNVFPWVLTVGASSIDRQFVNSVELPDGQIIKGRSMSKSSLDDKFYPLISAAEAKASNVSAKDAAVCAQGTLDPKKVKGKIVVCVTGVVVSIAKSREAMVSGAAGMILCNDAPLGDEIEEVFHLLPTSHIGYKDGVALYAYYSSTSEPMAAITASKSPTNAKPAPSMAYFSSRGPNPITPDILKPDIAAPGVNIIAAFSPLGNPTEEVYDKRRLPYHILSGTSMATPHAAGVVALLKSVHPNWSPAAIKSAIMTTARTRDNTVHPMSDEPYANILPLRKANPFSYGAGNIRPNRAMDPGLVYDLGVEDYLDFLCSHGYNQNMIKSFTERPHECSENQSLLNFNYPSISVPHVSSSLTVTRRLKNVGEPGVYTVRLREPSGVSLSVEPKVLKFDNIGEEKSFALTLKPKVGSASRNSTNYYGELIWSDGKHYVRSPIVAGFI